MDQRSVTSRTAVCKYHEVDSVQINLKWRAPSLDLVIIELIGDSY